MRTVLILGMMIAAVAVPAADDTTPSTIGTHVVAERGGHHRVVERVETEIAPDGREVARAFNYTEVATGLHYQNDQGEWLESKEEIEILPNGAGAVARQGQHKVYFAPDIATGEVIDFETSDGKRMRSRVIGLGYYDASNGEAVMLATVKSSEGQVFPPNRVLYPDAFDEVEADVEYIYRRSGFEQNIILRSKLTAPEAFNLNPGTTKLQLFTEFFDPPAPTKHQEILRTGLADEQLDFGAMQMGRGRAFLIGDETDDSQVPVSKHWINLESRTFLLEEVPLSSVASQINTLPARRRQASLDPERRGNGTNLLVALQKILPRRAAKTTTAKMKLARLTKPDPVGFVLDYTILTSQSDFTFACNTNYYISGLVNLTGTTTIEGGTTIKFTNSTSAKISMSGPLICLTDPYRPAVLTSKDDNTVGETIAGSTGNPTNFNGATYLYSSFSNPSNAIQYLRLSYAGTGLSFDGITNGVWHCQFLKCQNAIDSYNQKEVRLYNVLLAVSSNCIVNSTTVRGQHVTVDVCSNLVSATSASLALTNSILTAVAATGVVSPTYNQVVTAASGSGIYQVVGAASYYLAERSTNRNLGTTNLNATLANHLKSRTTYPPLVLSANITVSTTLSPQAMRDTDLPDLGYHYDPLDYVTSGKTVSANLTLANGVAVATYGSSGTYGLGLNSGGNFSSEGLPTTLNWIARYNTVQEQSTASWTATTAATGVQKLSSSPTVNARFTGWSVLGNSGDHFKDDTGSTTPSAFTHCQFGGGTFTIFPGSIALTNCLWQRVYVYFRDTEGDPQCYLFNNLFRGGRFEYRLTENPVLRAYDNLFDRTIIVKGTSGVNFTHDYNGYITGQNRLTSNGAHDVILTNTPVYLTSYLGRFYYPANDGMLSTLIDVGSRTADLASLYHFTTQAGSSSKETTSTVDIGFHYVGVDSNGNPLDYDGDGTPDYLEDTNGNGDVDSGETDWQNANDLGLKVFITEPKRNSNLP